MIINFKEFKACSSSLLWKPWRDDSWRSYRWSWWACRSRVSHWTGGSLRREKGIKEDVKSVITASEHLPNSLLPSGNGLERIIQRWAAESYSHTGFTKTIWYEKEKKKTRQRVYRPSETITAWIERKMKSKGEKLQSEEMWRPGKMNSPGSEQRGVKRRIKKIRPVQTSSPLDPFSPIAPWWRKSQEYKSMHTLISEW